MRSPGVILSVVLTLGGFNFCFAQRFETLGPGGCVTGDCHPSQETWYRSDPHSATLKTIDDNLETSYLYARSVGIQQKDLYKSGNLCMTCHATSATKRKEADEGVSCESCHGAGGGYKEPHQEGKGGGAARSGYAKGVAAGMADFRRDKQLVANTCVGCHYITNDALRTAGHKSGDDFKYPAKIAKVAGYPNHWQREAGADDKVKERFDKAMKARGPLSPVIPSPPKEDRQVAQAQTAGPAGTRTPPPPRQVPANRITAQVSAGPIDLPPFPTVTDSTRIDSLLLLLRMRLELLYEKTK